MRPGPLLTRGCPLQRQFQTRHPSETGAALRRNERDRRWWTARQCRRMINRLHVLAFASFLGDATFGVCAEVPDDYQGKPFANIFHKADASHIPALSSVRSAILGEGVACRDPRPHQQRQRLAEPAEFPEARVHPG